MRRVRPCQAATFEDKVRICQRSYKCLRENIDFSPEDMIFDCNVLTIATGLPEHNSYGIDFINAVAEIKRACPFVSFSGGMSNLSFSFRGLNSLRDAMRSVFLYHAVPKGLNMSIVNPGGRVKLPRGASWTVSPCRKAFPATRTSTRTHPSWQKRRAAPCLAFNPADLSWLDHSCLMLICR